MGTSHRKLRLQIFHQETNTYAQLCRRIGTNDWAIEIVDDSKGAFNYTSLAYNPSGNPSISYRLWPYSRQKYPGLKFAYWDGSSWVLEMVDPGVGTRHGIGNSLAYDPDSGVGASGAFTPLGSSRRCLREMRVNRSFSL